MIGLTVSEYLLYYYLTGSSPMTECEVAGVWWQKSLIHTSEWSLIHIISFGGVDVVKSVISIILVALLGHENQLFTVTPVLDVQHAKSCVSWIQTTYQKIGGCMLLLAELSPKKSQKSPNKLWEGLKVGKNGKFILGKLSSSKGVPYCISRKCGIFWKFLALFCFLVK